MILLPVSRLVELGFDIYSNRIFGSITLEQVLAASEDMARTGERFCLPYSARESRWDDLGSHIRRIATLVLQGWTDPIEIDVGIPGMQYWPDHPVMDGNHRLAAAIACGDEWIGAQLAGDMDYATELFDVECFAPQPLDFRLR